MLINSGQLTEETAKNHPGKNLLTRALGANDPIDIDIFDIDRSVKGLFLCSDGLTNMLTIEQIEKYVKGKKIMPIIKANGYGTHVNRCLELIEDFDIVGVARKM